MYDRLPLFALLGTMVLSGCGGDGGAGSGKSAAERAEQAYQATVEKRRETESMDEKLAFTKKFLDEFPESDRTASAVDAVYYYQAEELGDMAGAVAYAERVRGGVDDPEIAKAVDKVLIYVYGKSRMLPKMIDVADRLSAEGSLDFSDHSTVVESATEAEDWGLVRQYCEKARAFATEEAYRKERAGAELTGDEVARGVNRRVGMILVNEGWARAHQGEIEEALADFSRADSLVERSYVGVSDHDLDYYWGVVLQMVEKHRAAAEKLAVGALVMRDGRALAALKDAYVGLYGTNQGFDSYAARLHRSVRKPIGDFELADYRGDQHGLRDLRGEVTLLAFWFPT